MPVVLRWAKLVTGVFAAAFALGCGPTVADDRPFVTIYTTDLEEKGEAELEQYLIWKSGHAGALYDEFESRSEFEYGLTDDLQGSLYLNYDFAVSREHAPPGPLETQRTIGVSGELILRLLNSTVDPVGLALYAEPAWYDNGYSFETKFLLQKDFFDARLRSALNINLEDTWTHIAPGSYMKESALEFDLGSSWSVTRQASIGLEFDNEHAFMGEVLGTGASESSSGFYLGPTFAYVDDPWSITLGVQAQLPLAYGRADAVAGGVAKDAERYRGILKLAADL
jgi:hypothetical protein